MKAPYAAVAAFLLATAAFAAPIPIETAPLALNPDKPGQSDVGALRFMGGLVVKSSDRTFGSYSGMVLTPDGRLTAVSDEGHWLSLTLSFDNAGRLNGASGADIEAMRDTNSREIEPKSWRDAEALRRDRDGSFLVSFERASRIWRYRATSGAAEEIAVPRALTGIEGNDGVESLALLADGRLLAIEEGPDDGAPQVRAWIGRDGQWQERHYRRHGRFRPTDAVALPSAAPWSGDVLVLERRFTLIGGVAARIVRVPARQFAESGELSGIEIAELVPPVSVDNMECIDVIMRGDGRLEVFILSDDNQNPLQRTILMQFELKP